MSGRYTKYDVERAFRRLATALNKPVSTRNGYEFGPGWLLDYSQYGGFVIKEVLADSGEKHPFGPERKRAREFCEMVEFAITAISHDRNRTIEFARLLLDGVDNSLLPGTRQYEYKRALVELLCDVLGYAQNDRAQVEALLVPKQ